MCRGVGLAILYAQRNIDSQVVLSGVADLTSIHMAVLETAIMYTEADRAELPIFQLPNPGGMSAFDDGARIRESTCDSSHAFE